MNKNIDPNAPILIFDTGVGGLTVLAALRRILPQAPVIFAADQAGLPYGTKSEAEIAARVSGLLGRMSERYRPRLACIACNTASTIALGIVREVLEIPIVGTVPAIKPAAAITKTGTIGLLGTEATIRQAYVDNLESEFAQGKRLIRYAAPGLVAPAEAKLRGLPVDMDAVAQAVSGLREMDGGEDIDTIVLACTHFPLLSEELGELLGPKTRLIDGAEGIAHRIAELTIGQPFNRTEPDRAVTTGGLETFEPLRNSLERLGINVLEQF